MCQYQRICQCQKFSFHKLYDVSLLRLTYGKQRHDHHHQCIISFLRQTKAALQCHHHYGGKWPCKKLSAISSLIIATGRKERASFHPRRTHKPATKLHWWGMGTFNRYLKIWLRNLEMIIPPSDPTLLWAPYVIFLWCFWIIGVFGTL